jgi:glycosyltransferase involved in cell wall biosynthesis
MRICVDGTSLLLRSAGVKNYVFHWLTSMAAQLPEQALSIFPLLGTPATLHHDRSVLTPLETYPRIALLHSINRIYRPAIDWAIGNVDVFHTSNQVKAIPGRCKLTATVYDFTVLLLPEHHTEGNRLAERGFHQRVLQRADGLIAISESTKNDGIRLVGLNPEKVRVIYPGIDDRFKGPHDVDAVRLRYGLHKPFVLYVGTIEPRKNLHTLLDAWEALPTELRQEHDLVFGGPTGWGSEQLMARIRAGVPGLRLLGYVPEQDLPSVTAAASVFAYPSIYEGFGFPPAQAMAAGVPVVTSNVSSLPEVVGDAGILIDPNSASELSAAMQDLLLSPTKRQTLGGRGRERAGQFSWSRSAHESIDFFRRVIG